mgnify:CR=1 FL=1
MANGAMPIAQPTGRAGELYIPSLGRTIKLIEWRDGDFDDSVPPASGAVSAGTSLELFRDLANKNLQHSNLRTARHIPANSELIMNRVGVVIAQAFSNTITDGGDILKVAYAATLTFKINDRLVSEGPLFMYQSGYGMAGSTTRNNEAVYTTGVPSAAAAPQLLVAQSVIEPDDLQGTVDFKNDIWITTSSVMPTLTGRVVVTNSLHGFIKKASGS